MYNQYVRHEISTEIVNFSVQKEFLYFYFSVIIDIRTEKRAATLIYYCAPSPIEIFFHPLVNLGAEYITLDRDALKRRKNPSKMFR